MQEIMKQGLMERSVSTINAKVFSNEQMVYFFEPIDSHTLRLYSIVNKRSLTFLHK